MPKWYPGTVQTAYRDLLDHSQAAAFDAAFADSGTFVKKPVKGRTYWYFRTKGKENYVGPETEALLKRIADHRKLRLDERQRRTTVAMLKRAGLPSPTPQIGELLKTLSRAGIFRVRTCLVGTQAFGCYPGQLGARLSGASLSTQDLDIAQFQSISLAISEDERLETLLDVLRTVDPSYRPLTKTLSESKPIAYVNNKKYKIEVLTPNRGPDRDEPMQLPAIGSYAHPFRFLDFLIYDAVPAVVLHGEGVMVNVPAPERFAVHKLIVAHRRKKDSDKISKDLSQAAQLIDAMWEMQREDLLRVFREAIGRGDSWRKSIIHSLSNIEKLIPPEAATAFSDSVGTAIQPA